MDLDKIQQLIKLLKEEGVAEFSYEDSEFNVALKLAGAAPAYAPVAAPVAAAPAAAAPAAVSADTFVVASPMVGTFYRAAKPGAPAFVEVGTRVHKGQALCIVEAMKLMNEIEAEVDGVVTEILVENARPVQFGQALVKIRKG